MSKFRNTGLLILLIGFLGCFFSCNSKMNQIANSSKKSMANPPALGFDSVHSDPKAIDIANKVMEAMGGRKNWDNTRFIRWNFFGSRTLLWDKKEKLVRIDSKKEEYKAIVQLDKLEGKIWKDGALMTQPDSLSKYLKRAKSIWINDSYWLVMPYKLMDSGVTLKYIGEGQNEKEVASHILELQFKDVGNTPENKYQVWVNKDNYLVSQWSFYPTASTEEPRFITAWENYEQHGNILLSSSRGPNYTLSEIQVFKQLEPPYKKSFTSFLEE